MKLTYMLFMSLIAFNSHAKDLIDYVSEGNQIAIENLLELGVDPNIERDNQTPLSAAFTTCKNNIDSNEIYVDNRCVKFANDLIKSGADINWTNSNGNNIVMLMSMNLESNSSCFFPEKVIDPRECHTFMEYLYDHSFEFSAKNNDGDSFSNLLATTLNHAPIPKQCIETPYICEDTAYFQQAIPKEAKGYQNLLGQTPLMQRINLSFWKTNSPFIDINISDNADHTPLTYLLDKSEMITSDVMDLFLQFILPSLDLNKIIYNGKTQKQLIEEYYQKRATIIIL